MTIQANSPQAKSAYRLVKGLQAYFVDKLDGLSQSLGNNQPCETLSWERDEGRHGGGMRYETRDATLFNSGSVNISQVHYDDIPTKSLSSATAISTIIHPHNPHVPSMHMHISWTQMRDGKGYWRIMADLNPSLENQTQKEQFDTMLQKSAGVYATEGMQQGDRYFHIPVLERTRGVSHFYLEDFNGGDFQEDSVFAKSMGEAVIDTYIEIVRDGLKANATFTQEQKKSQLAYHTLYLFQVLTLDRGTTSGLLVHAQNDIGILGSIPSHIDSVLLASWVAKMPQPQEQLVQALLDALPTTHPTPVEDSTKKKLANAVRSHYALFPEALSMQASGDIIPPTVQNHQ